MIDNYRYVCIHRLVYTYFKALTDVKIKNNNVLQAMLTHKVLMFVSNTTL